MDGPGRIGLHVGVRVFEEVWESIPSVIYAAFRVPFISGVTTYSGVAASVMALFQ